MAKKTTTYTVDENVLDMFNQLSKLTATNKSQWLENKMIEFIETETKEK